ncbi:hypothetical protein GH714_005244 [Hevea brasiliensis]|uniref:Uncharacterized protein n=1 Tax=Hevea brasiliensis TaxID=3981 RepID=A0A6A6KXU8_HEVBR|nr:hypothetical protein GH714_005244 [Hevea brasiliensis]
MLQAKGLLSASTSIEEDPISQLMNPVLIIPFYPWYGFKLAELSKFESPLARLDLSFLSTLKVTSPSLDPMSNLAKVQEA